MNLKKRIFVGIELDEIAKKNLTNTQRSIDREFLEINPIKWTKEENLHITLFFIGYVYYNDLSEIIISIEEAIKNFKPFRTNFKKINYFPEKEYSKKMIWVFGERDKNLEGLHQEIKKVILGTQKESQPFYPHITLGRISSFEFTKINPDELPQIENTIDLQINVKTITIFESELKKGGAQYTAIKKFNL